MNSNSRFMVAVHILSGLALVKQFKKDEWITSERIAWSVNTNPVVVRRILAKLGKAGLVCSAPGAAGGSKLAVDSRKTTLLEIYQAVEENIPAFFQKHSPNEACPIGANIFSALDELNDRIFSSIQKELKEVTLSYIASQIQAHAKRSRQTKTGKKYKSHKPLLPHTLYVN
ncbi:MAG: Rrf2 family transcriptional regulator [bacterium]